MKTILEIVMAVLRLFGLLKQEQAQAREQEVGVLTQKEVQQEQVIHEVELANDARDIVDRQLRADPASLRDDDGFKRAD
jgi:hypothetical protein